MELHGDSLLWGRRHSPVVLRVNPALVYMGREAQRTSEAFGPQSKRRVAGIGVQDISPQVLGNIDLHDIASQKITEVGNIVDTTLQFDEMAGSDARVETEVDEVVPLDGCVVCTQISESCPERSGCASVVKDTPNLEGFVEEFFVLIRPSRGSIMEGTWSPTNRDVNVVGPDGLVFHLPDRVGVCLPAFLICCTVCVAGRGSHFAVVGSTGRVREPFRAIALWVAICVGALGDGALGDVHGSTQRLTAMSPAASGIISKKVVGSYRTLCCRGVGGRSLSLSGGAR